MLADADDIGRPDTPDAEASKRSLLAWRQNAGYDDSALYFRWRQWAAVQRENDH
jgi:hypothetical protein